MPLELPQFAMPRSANFTTFVALDAHKRLSRYCKISHPISNTSSSPTLFLSDLSFPHHCHLGLLYSYFLPCLRCGFLGFKFVCGCIFTLLAVTSYTTGCLFHFFSCFLSPFRLHITFPLLIYLSLHIHFSLFCPSPYTLHFTSKA